MRHFAAVLLSSRSRVRVAAGALSKAKRRRPGRLRRFVRPRLARRDPRPAWWSSTPYPTDTTVPLTASLRAPRRTSRCLVAVLAVAGCSAPPPVAEVAFTIPEPLLIPEGIAYDPVDGAFYVGSTNLRKIVRIGADGSIGDFAADGGLWGVVGLTVDPERRVLWAASSHAGAGMPFEGMDPSEEGRAGIFAYDLSSGALLGTYLLDATNGGHFLNDVAVTGDGSLYATDSGGRAIYRIAAGRDSLELFLAPPDLPWPNGITWSEEAGVLFVALDGRIGRVAPGDPTVEYVELPAGVEAHADGLYYRDGSLITVWPFEGMTGVTRYRLDDAHRRVTAVERILPAHPSFVQPTTGAVAGDALYVVANSQLQLFRAIRAGEIPGGPEQLVEPVILRVDLGGSGGGTP